MSVGGTLREILRVWARALPSVLPAAAVVLVPLELLIAVFDPANDVSPNRGLYAALFIATNLVAIAWVSGAIVRYLEDGGSALGAYARLEGARSGLVFGTWLASLGTLIGLVLLVVPGLIVGTRWSLVVPSAALEQRGPIEALQRSNELVKGQTGRVLGVMLLSALLAFTLLLVVAIAAEVASPGFVASLALGLGVDLLALPLMVTAAWVVYRRLATVEPSAELA